MRIQFLLLSALILLAASCKPDKEATSLPVDPVAAATKTASTAAQRSEGIDMNDITRNLVDGLWYVTQVFERQPTPRYQAQKGRYYNFEPNGDYALFNPDGSLFHFGKWRYKPGDGDRNYISIDAADPQYNNQYKVLMSKEDAVFVGTAAFDNPGLQQRLEKLTTPPASAIKAQQQ